jgi:hypothetical protein
VRAGESQIDVEAELESEDPMEMGDDVISSEEEGGWDAGATSVARHEPTATPTSGGRDTERRDDALAPRKHATSSNAVGEREAKQTRSPCPSKERARTRASLGPPPVRDPQWGNTPPAAPVSAPRVGGRGDS